MKVVRALGLSIALVGGCAAHTPTPEKPRSAPSATTPATDDDAIARAGQAYVDLLVQISPETATQLGLHARDTELDDRSLAGFERDLAREQAMLDDLTKRFAHPNASLASRTDLSILEHSLLVDIRSKRENKPLERRPDVYTNPMNALFSMTAREYAPAAERAKNSLARIEKLPAQLEQAKANLKRPPRVWTQIGIESAAGAKQFFDDERVALEAALPQDKARVDAALVAAQKAYAEYKQFLETTILPRSDGDFAAGPEYFDFLLKQDFFLTEGAAGIEAEGMKVLASTQTQMDEVAKRIDPKAKGWPEVVAKVKAHHPTADALLPSYRTELTRARKFLIDKDVVTLPPGDDCEVIDTPPFQRSTVTAAYDQPPPFDAVTKGFFFVTPVDKTLAADAQEQMLRENDHGDEVDTAVHEAYPGHHLQLSIARRHPSVIRKATGPAIFAEGWALYSEELMSELGMYTDEERLMQLEWTLVRAARIVIDVGLHTKGMTFDAAVAMLQNQAHLERELAMSEVKRYTESPTQPSSYLIGRQKILAMRERAKKEWGTSYSLKRFHDELLGHGTIAPGLLESEMF